MSIILLLLSLINPHSLFDADRDGDVDLQDWACVQNDGGDHAEFVQWFGGSGVDAMGHW